MPRTAMGTTPSAGTPEAPKITLLGSIDADQGTPEMMPEGGNPKPFLAIIYNGI
ncbi:hypothetical protein [Streptomyces fuscichromogenes]|uniref:Uncharacterized protein n=1 Tax=Streptomyces fuscichromogenes TaxID=1324013 RepID=A0A917XA82_9ACTN|nr:hypothetical protein [Streptomyces fuscichromogenes]GGN00523.1 hypothetical protein GCM10011578_022250 [Streptomyces fuscichromogenes]